MKTFLLLALFISSLSVSAQTRDQCIANVKQNTRVSSATLGGTVTGTGVGLVGCAVFLALSPIDFGISYAACVSGAAGVGGMVGNTNAHSEVEDEIVQCNKIGA